MGSNGAQVCIKSNKKIEQRLWLSLQTMFCMNMEIVLLPHVQYIYNNDSVLFNDSVLAENIYATMTMVC